MTTPSDMRTAPFSRVSQFRVDLFRETKQYWLFPLWTEVDMGRAEALREEWKRQGARVTYTALVVKAVADAIGELQGGNPELNAAVLGFPFKRMAYFDGVDVAVASEKRYEETEYFHVGILRDCGRRPLPQIAEELARLAASTEGEEFESTRALIRKPHLVRRCALWASRNFPALVRKYRGTVFVSSVGKYGVNAFAMTNHNISFSFGEVSARPAVSEGAVVVRPQMILTMVIDHRVINGGPAARLLARVKRRLEEGSFTLDKEIAHVSSPHGVP